MWNEWGKENHLGRYIKIRGLTPLSTFGEVSRYMKELIEKYEKSSISSERDLANAYSVALNFLTDNYSHLTGDYIWNEIVQNP